MQDRETTGGGAPTPRTFPLSHTARRRGCAGSAADAHVPVNTGLRFSRNDATPSSLSLEPTSATLSRFSWSV
jgi:hypothetical protein